ncbi:MAG: tRNA lysidine(34) synthetase TilS [Anaerolineales bacterium]
MERSEALLVGVSGGPDSLALMLLLHRLNWKLIVAHLNHQLRPTADKEEQGVRRWAEQIGAIFVSGRVNIAAHAYPYPRSIEETARYYRYRFLFEQAEKMGAKAVLVAHTADDQVETVLMRLIRGAGTQGLVGMRTVTLPNEWSETIPLVRPLLSIWRSQIMEYLSQQKVEPFVDETNYDPFYTRNRIRHYLIPDLERYNPSIRKLIWQTAQILADEDEFMQAQEEIAWQETVCYRDEERVGFDLETFRRLPQALRRRLVRRAYQVLYPGIDPLEFAQVENVVNTLLAPQVARRRINRLVNCLRDYEIGYLLMRFALPPDQDYPQLPSEEELALPLSGSLPLNDGWTLQVETVSEQPYQAMQQRKANRFEAWLDAQVCQEGLWIRPPREGDRFAPLSMGGRTNKISKIFIDRKIPIYVRARYPLIVNQQAILWVPGYTISHFARLTPESRAAVHLRLEQTRHKQEGSTFEE